MILKGSQEGKLHNFVKAAPKGTPNGTLRGTMDTFPNLSNPLEGNLRSPLAVYRVRDWLRSGWILELAETKQNGSQTDFLIGGGDRAELSFDDLEPSSCAIWAPGFFSVSSQGGFGQLHVQHQGAEAPAAQPFATQWIHQVSRADLLAWLFEDIEKKEKNGPASGAIPSAKISWRSPKKEDFQKAFERLGKAFREEGVKKAVPVVFAEGVTATDDRLEWLRSRMLSGLGGTLSNHLRLYGCWSEDSGFLGATPEEFFSRDGEVLTSMAVAGTRAVRALGERAQDPAALEKFSSDFLNDPKERSEHLHVVNDIEKVLGATGGTIEKGPTLVERFGALLHLVTRFKVSNVGKTAVRELVENLHPTPALGVWPRDPQHRLLRELHSLAAGTVEREGFGAPFVVKFGERVESVVAIRQIRWNFEDGDRARVTVGSGCGVVPESDIHREWDELAAKREAVMKLFRLSTENPEPVFWSLKVLQKVLDLGVRHFVVCAGARNAPLVVAAEALRNSSDLIQVESFFEERSAAFYALGAARATGRPVAVLTTSGTAVSELLPAMAEADYSGVPLIAITADRPRRLRYSGAPQSMPQHRVFEGFSEYSWDLEEGDAFTGLDAFVGRELSRPLHFNIALDEPLLSDAEKNPKRLAELAQAITGKIEGEPSVGSKGSPVPDAFSMDPSLSFAALGAVFESRRTSDQRGVVAIVGALRVEDRSAVAEFLSAHQVPCLVEAPSGLRGDVRLRDIELRGGDRDLQRWCLAGEISHVIRLGGVPTTRVWRDLDDVEVPTQTLSISHLRFSGLSRGQFVHLPGPGEFRKFLRDSTSSTARQTTREKKWIDEDRHSHEKLERLVKMLPQSEPSFVHALSQVVPEDALVYVGNSLPIRWWDMVATRSRATVVEANRGVNGIDGQISTALGLARGARPSELWILVGDLTALYDLSSPWAISKLKSAAQGVRTRVVVLNNSGGRIFTRVLAKAPGGATPFENEHDLGFEHWAKMWKLEYHRMENAAELAQVAGELGEHAVLEMIPSSESTQDFWSGLTSGPRSLAAT